MGVRGLWDTIENIGEHKSLYELQNQTIAIDLSHWICECKNVKFQQSNAYLRIIFYRTLHLLILGIKPIFILEREIPDFKYGAILNKRHWLVRILGSRKERFGDAQRRIMGMPYYYSQHEGEALCAVLNFKGIVDGIITEDGDCFLYGGKIIYKDFKISYKKDEIDYSNVPREEKGEVKMFAIKSAEREMNLGRNKMIAMATFWGCDYDCNGVPGVGQKRLLEYFDTVNDSEILERLLSWKRNYYTPNSKIEAMLKEKALGTPNFPFIKMQKHYLENDMDVSKICFVWKKPNILNFIALAKSWLKWGVRYSIRRFLPMLTRWHLLHDEHKSMEIDYIAKEENSTGKLIYFVKWKKYTFLTREPKSLLENKYTSFIDEFTKAKQKGRKTFINRNKFVHRKRSKKFRRFRSFKWNKIRNKTKTYKRKTRRYNYRFRRNRRI